MLTEAAARHALQALLNDYHKFPPERLRTFSESEVVHQFLDRLFRDVLGWPIEDNDRYKLELHTKAGRPDITLLPESGGTLFVEAKKFGVIKELEQARYTIAGTITPGQMALPGMSVDRTPEEQQAINYAFENGGTWAVLTNFEKLRLFNARRDWLVLSFESPGALLQDFDLLWQLAYRNILTGSLDRLSNQRHTEEVDTVYLEFINTWRERLAQDVLRNLKANPWVKTADGGINLHLLRDVVQRYIDRLVLIRFAEDHLVIPPGTLYSMYELRRNNPYTFSMDEHIDGLFRKFDRAHNSALFTRGVTDEAEFSDDELLALVEKLYAARYRAMPADILGNTYEQYLGKTLVLDGNTALTRDNLETRKKQGSYYTPQVIVRYMVDQSLGRYLTPVTDAKNGVPTGESVVGASASSSPSPASEASVSETRQRLGGEASSSALGEVPKTLTDIRHLRVLDAACGSGSFLIYAYQVLAEFYEAERARLETERLTLKRELANAGMIPTEIEADARVIVNQAQLDSIADYPRLILEKHLYGVDLDPQAAEIAVVNLMMRGMERQRTKKRLPLILNQNVKAGNSLVGLRADDPALRDHAPALASIRSLRLQLTDPAYDDDHERIIAALERETAALYEAVSAPFANAFHDPDRAKPFHWGIEFPEVFYDEHGALLPDGGFDIILGNPPWEIVKPDLREFYARYDAQIESRLNRAQVESRIAELDAEDPTRRAELNAIDQAAADFSAYVKASADYTRQGRGDLGTHKLFLERAYGLLRTGGRLGYVVPSGLYTDLGTKDLREMLLNDGNIQYIYSFSNERYFFPGVDHRFKFAMLGAQKGPQTDGFTAAFRFNPRVAVAPGDLPAFLSNPDNLIYVRKDSIKKFSPENFSIMEFQNKRDYEVAERIYGSHPQLGDALEGTWNVKFTREFDKTNDRHMFNTTGQGLPVFEGENFWFYGEILREPSFWIKEEEGRADLLRPLRKQAPNLPANQIPLDYEHDRFGFRRIAASTNERTLVVSWVPRRSFAMYTLTTTVQHYFDGSEFKPYMTKPQEMFLYACMASYVLDYLMRFQVSSSVAMFNAYSLPIPRLNSGDRFFDALVPLAARLVCTRAEFAGLWESVMGGKWSATSGVTDAAGRQALRDQIDGLVAHLYGLSRADYEHILGTFPLVFPPDAVGAARRSAALKAYDSI